MPDQTVPQPFPSAETAMLWLQSLLEDDERMWRLETHVDWLGSPPGRYFQVRAYPMGRGGGWHNGQAQTLIEAIAWLRHGIEKGLS